MPLLRAESLATRTGPDIASVAWLTLNLDWCGAFRPGRHGSRTGPGDPPGHRRWCCCTRSASGPRTGRWSRGHSRPRGAYTRPTCAGTAPATGPAGYTIEQLATDLATFVDALELEQTALGGHSVGAPPAYLYAARHPGRVTRLILEDPAPPWPREPRTPARPEGPLPFDWAATALSNDFTSPQADSWRDELRWIQAPALLIAGGPASHIDQGQLAGMAAIIPDCELVTIPPGTWYTPSSQPGSPPL